MKKQHSIAIILVAFVSVFLLSACSLNEFFQNIYDVFFTPSEQEEEEEQNNGTGTPVNEFEYEVTTQNDAVTNLSLSGTTLSWDEGEQEQYVVAVYSGSDYMESYTTDNEQFSLATIAQDHPLLAYRVGYETDEDHLVLTPTAYYNANNIAPYTSTIYYFNGTLADYYITGQTELNQLAHYLFIYRKDSASIKLSSTFVAALNNFNQTSVNTALQTAFNDSFLETMALSYSYTVTSYSNATMTLNLDFNGEKEAFRTLQKTYEQDQVQEPYYETVDYTPREATYDDFATDDNIMSAPVSTSEELYWAVESGATPVFSNTTNEGYLIYQEAKQVLRTIISDDMSDYEKLLSIYDWIAQNTVYDYQIVDENNTYTGSNSYTEYTSFYLEGVFEDGLAVCDGFSKAFALLANMEGILTYRIVGTALGGGHAWNKTYLNGNWYAVDITWTEIETEHYQTDELTEYLTHKYFLVSDTVISDHITSSTNSYKNFSAPNNYLYYTQTTFEFEDQQYDLEITTTQEAQALINYMWEQYRAGAQAVSIDVIISATVLNNWGTLVRGVKDAYNEAYSPLRFDNDVLTIGDDSYIQGYASGEVVVVLQVLDTYLNLLNS